MMLEPRKVEPGFCRRWLQQAFGLLGRTFHLWFGLALCWSLLTWALGGNGLSAIALGLFFYFFSVEMAAMSDQHVVRLGHVPGAVARAARGAVLELWEKRFALLLAGVMVLGLLWWQPLDPQAQAELAAAAAAKTPPDLGNPLTWLFSAESPLVYAAVSLFAGLLLQGKGLHLVTLRYPLRRAFELSDDQVSLLLSQAAQKNRGTLTLMEAGMPIAVGLLVLLFPGAVPLLACVLPAVSYVAFREIFIDDQGNRKQATAAGKTTFAGVMQ